MILVDATCSSTRSTPILLNIPQLADVLSSSSRSHRCGGSLDRDAGISFLRLTTHPAVMRHPLQIDRALNCLDDWLHQPSVVPIAPGSNHWAIFRNLLRATKMTGSLTSDAHLAALAIEHGGEIYSTDNDFKRFPGITHVNPLAAR